MMVIYLLFLMFKGVTYPNPCVFGCFWLIFGEGGEISAVSLQIFFGHSCQTKTAQMLCW